MITNLFSIFDPSSRILHLSLNWVALAPGVLLFSSHYWVVTNSRAYVVSTSIRLLTKEMITLLKSFAPRIIFTLALFFTIVFNNVLGLLPCIFTPTRHLAITLPLALSLWLGYFAYGWFTHTQHILRHLVPQGTPVLLISLIVVIETIRGLIRPLTLSVRLIANIVAGHLLLALAGGAADIFSLSATSLAWIAQSIILILEIAVACIQAYVFRVLTTLYIREV